MKKLLVVLMMAIALICNACKEEKAGPKNVQKSVQAAKVAPVNNFIPSRFPASPYVREIKPLRCAANSFVAVQFNACNFGRSKSDQELLSMAQMFRPVNLIVIEEVSTSDFGAQAVAKLAGDLNYLGGKWDYAVSDATHKGSGSERYGFIWRSDHLTAIPHKPVLMTQLARELEREPAKMTFKFAGKTFDIFSFHLVPTDKIPMNEVKVLGAHPEIFSAANCILVGDFNLSYNDLISVMERRLNFNHQIEGRTSLKQNIEKGNYYKSEYDNILLRGNFVVCQAGILDFVPDFPSLKEARQISDHLPVFVEIALN